MSDRGVFTQCPVCGADFTAPNSFEAAPVGYTLMDVTTAAGEARKRLGTDELLAHERQVDVVLQALVDILKARPKAS